MHRSIPTVRALRLLGAAAALTFGAAAASAQQTFVNATTITIPSFGAATPYPSVVTVAGATGVPTSVELRGFSHTFLADVDIALVGPTNQALMLFSEQGWIDDAQNATVTFSDAGIVYPGGVIAGAQHYRPVGGTGASHGGTLPGGLTFVQSFADLAAASVNGVWSLYVFDDGNGDGGRIQNGWAITVAPAATSTVPEPATVTLLGGGLLAIGAVVRRRTSRR
jgi:subtilisin-like proprotein convertase family protein